MAKALNFNVSDASVVDKENFKLAAVGAHDSSSVPKIVVVLSCDKLA